MSLRRRLHELAAPEAHGVTVLTYHGLAMLLTGRSFAGMAATDSEPDFDAVLREATALLRGEHDPGGLPADETRERLLGGFQYIIVDEYQDIDELQYELIAALSGKRLARDERLSLLAVGDDDQNIYRFRGANVAFIRRFREDYGAQVHYLTENYRSTAHIVAAASQLIAANRDRMKSGRVLTVNQARRTLPPGGAWQKDPVSRGRVQRLRVAGRAHQAWCVVQELLRLRTVRAGVEWRRCAVLAREWDELGPVRALCEEREIPVNMVMPGAMPPLFRIREIAVFLERLRLRESEGTTIDCATVRDWAAAGAGSGSPWAALLIELAADWKRECGGAEVPAGQAVDFFYEMLAELRREKISAPGVFFSTIHSVKGMEFDHVLIIDRAQAPKRGEIEDERRLFYVGMTRARLSLALLCRDDGGDPFAGELSGDFLLERRPEPPPPGIGAALRQYAVCSLRDLDVGYAGARPERERIHRALAALRCGSPLRLAPCGEGINLMDGGGTVVGRLSRAGAARLRPRLERIIEARVAAVVRWRREDSPPEFRDRCRCRQWEIPIPELVLGLDKAGP